MIVRTVHLPSAYANPRGDADVAEHLLAMLESLLDGAVILLDSDAEQGTLFREIERHLLGDSGGNAQPGKTRARELLSELKKAGRLVPISITRVKDDGNPCRCALRIANQEKPDFLVTPDRCGCGIDCSTCWSGRTVSPNRFHSSGAAATVRQRRSYSTRVGAGTQPVRREDVAREVWQPLFVDASNVRIYDRYIGRSFQKSRDWETCDYERACPRFAATINWILAEFTRHSHQQSRRFIVNTDLRTFDDRRRVQWEREALVRQHETLLSFGSMLAKWAESISKQAGRPPIAVEIRVRLAHRVRAMAHGRYLFTNHASLQFDPGFDMVEGTSSAVSKVDIAHFRGDAGLIEHEFGSLEPAPINGFVPF